MKSRISRILSVLLALSLVGATEVAQAWQTTTPAQTQQAPVTNQQAPAASQPQTSPADQQAMPATDQQTAPAANQQQAPATDQQQTEPSPTPAPAQDKPAPAPVKENNASDPTYVPAPTEVLPNAPEATPAQQQAPTTTTPATPTTTQQPLGTAAAEKGVTRGGAASKPAGTAVAGKKQKQSRGLLIKVGAALAAGAALGTVYALSKGTSPTPPGATRPAFR